MDSRHILLSLGLALMFWILARGLRRTHRLPGPTETGRAAAAADVSAAACAFLAVLFLLKILPLLGPPSGLLRSDYLFPLWALWRRGNGVHWLLPVVVVGMLLIAAVVRSGNRSLPVVPATAVLMALAATLWLSLSLTNGGWPEGALEPLIRSADYYIDASRFVSLPALWSDYVTQQPGLSVHGRTHPPGALTVLWILDRIWGGYVPGVALSIILLSTLGLIPVVLWARRFLPPQHVQAAAILWILTPAVALYGATSMDMIFAVPLLAAGSMFALAVAGHGESAHGDMGDTRQNLRHTLCAMVAGIFLAIGFLFTFSAAVLAMAWVLSITLIPRDRRRRALAMVTMAGTACITVLGIIALVTGFDPVACLSTAMALDAGEAPAHLSLRYYLLTRLMGILDHLVLSGVAISPLWLMLILRGWKPAAPAEPPVAHSFALESTPPSATPSPRTAPDDPILLALARGAALAVALFLALGVYKIGETGRILLFLLPFLLIPTVRRLSRQDPQGRAGTWALGVVAAWHLGQTILMEWFLDTRW